MSLKVMSHVWEHSQQKGSYLVTMLAIADYAHDDGTRAYPSMATLAKKTRMTERNVQLVLRRLEEDEELIIHANAGPHGCNMYTIPLAAPGTTPPTHGGEKFLGKKKPGGGEKSGTQGVKSAALLQPQISPNPLLDPSEEKKTDPGISFSSSTMEKKEESATRGFPPFRKTDEEPDKSWTKAAVIHPRPESPDEALDALDLEPATRARLETAARQRLNPSGSLSVYLFTGHVHTAMLDIWEEWQRGAVGQGGCEHEHVNAFGACNDRNGLKPAASLGV